jgi:hypothetical protein
MHGEYNVKIESMKYLVLVQKDAEINGISCILKGRIRRPYKALFSIGLWPQNTKTDKGTMFQIFLSSGSMCTCSSYVRDIAANTRTNATHF